MPYKNKEDKKNNVKKHYKRRKNEKKRYIQDYKLSKGCSVCGYNKCASALDFHHNGDKKFILATAPNNGCSLEKIEKEMEKCIILCANCHRELHEKYE